MVAKAGEPMLEIMTCGGGAICRFEGAKRFSNQTMLFFCQSVQWRESGDTVEKPTREVPIEAGDIEKELAEAGCLRDYTAEDLEVTLWKLTGEIEEIARKIVRI
jgi:hypothetical protein